MTEQDRHSGSEPSLNATSGSQPGNNEANTPLNQHRPIVDAAAARPPLPIVPRPTRFGRVEFAHPAEADFARLLDFYRVKWAYEPTSFTLDTDRHGRVTQMFTPDFYLPEHDLYVELTTMKQSLITKKRRKLRRLKSLFPEVNVVLLTRRDYYELLSQFGYGAVEITSLPEEDIERILFSQIEIGSRVDELGAEISLDYAGRSLILVGLLKGVAFFMADLARAITRPLAIDFLSVAPPHDDQSRRVRFTRRLDLDVADQHVLLIEDIATTGMTLDYVVRHLRTLRPASLETCVLFDKRAVRMIDVPVRYIGFEVPNAFVVGYGLDYQERYRNLPFLCVLKPEVYAREHEDRLEAFNDATQHQFGLSPSAPADE